MIGIRQIIKRKFSFVQLDHVLFELNTWNARWSCPRGDLVCLFNVDFCSGYQFWCTAPSANSRTLNWSSPIQSLRTIWYPFSRSSMEIQSNSTFATFLQKLIITVVTAVFDFYHGTVTYIERILSHHWIPNLWFVDFWLKSLPFNLTTTNGSIVGSWSEIPLASITRTCKYLTLDIKDCWMIGVNYGNVLWTGVWRNVLSVTFFTELRILWTTVSLLSLWDHLCCQLCLWMCCSDCKWKWTQRFPQRKLPKCYPCLLFTNAIMFLTNWLFFIFICAQINVKAHPPMCPLITSDIVNSCPRLEDIYI